MNEQNKDVQQQGTRESKHAVPAAAAPSFSWKRAFGKKWVFPAVYMAAAAIILTLMWVYQGSGINSTSNKDTALTQTVTETVSKPGGDAVAVSAQVETMQWPVNKSEVTVSTPFYDDNATEDMKAKAVVQYPENSFMPHVGIDLARADGKEFDVMAAMSGKVTLVEKNVMVGDQVEITHPDGMVTVYQSLKDVKVTKGQDVKKGDVLAKSGINELEKDHGTHLHFEVRQTAEGPTLNPEQFLTAATGATGPAQKK